MFESELIGDRYKDSDGSVSNQSIFELLDAASASSQWAWPERLPWKVYYHDCPLAAFVKYVDDNWATLFGGNVYHISDLFGGFFHDVSHDSLPTYSFIEPRYTDIFLGTPNSNHPGGSDINGNPPQSAFVPVSCCCIHLRGTTQWAKQPLRKDAFHCHLRRARSPL